MRNPYRVNFAYLYPEMMFELISLNILHSMINVLFIVELWKLWINTLFKISCEVSIFMAACTVFK